VATLALSICGVAAWCWPVRAFIGPPTAGGAAASYRRLVFLLNLNPVLWDRVRAETDVIAATLERASRDHAASYRTQIDALLETPAAAPLETPADRRRRAERIFALSTRAIASALVENLRRIGVEDGDDTRADAVAQARALWGAFTPEIAVTDPQAFVTLEKRWRVLTDVTGAAQRTANAAAAQAIGEYVTKNYVDTQDDPDGAAPEPNRRIAPLPDRSPTFDAATRLPAKLPPGTDIDIQLPRPRQFLNMAAHGVSETETVLIALGDMAFNSSHILGEPARSLGITCNTCHNKGATNPKLFVPGLSERPGGIDVSNSFFAPHANNGRFDPLDTPDLRGIRFTSPYGRNGRFPSLREFIRNGIMHEFNGPEPDSLIVDAMIAYMNEFDFLPNASLGPDGSLRPDAPAAARRGEAIFRTSFDGLGGRSCATCHDPSDHFIDRRRHDIGTVAGSTDGSRDRALDTPTLLGSRHTAPYFHDGSQATLRAVNEWFNERFTLGLGETQLADLTTYLEVVGDGQDPYENTLNCLEAEFREFEFFLSTFEFLVEQERPRVLEIVFRTIATEIHKHEALLQNQAHLPTMRRLSALMEEAGTAVASGDTQTAAANVADYRELYHANASHLR
jgi:hypothetical protein